MGRLTVAPDPKSLASSGVAAGTTSAHWSGYMNAASYNRHSMAYIDYYESTAVYARNGIDDVTQDVLDVYTHDNVTSWDGTAAEYIAERPERAVVPGSLEEVRVIACAILSR